MGGPGSGRRPWKGSKPLKNWGGGKGSTYRTGSAISTGGTSMKPSPTSTGRLGSPKAVHVGKTFIPHGVRAIRVKVGTKLAKPTATKKWGKSKEWRRQIATMLRSKPKSMRRMLLKHIKQTA